MHEELSCAICRDLIPLVRDEVASEDSRALVARHIAHCPECRAEMGGANAPPVPADAPIFKKTRRALFLRLAACVVLGLTLGLALRVDASFLYNLLIMPLAGAALYLFGGKRWLLGPCAIAAAGAVCQMAALPLTRQETSFWPVVGLAGLIGLAYGLLALLGGAIAALFKYAFTKGETER